ncbi:MAG: hypothetical protein AAFZ63_26775 [Bacteroidota bacterium]
MNLQRNPLFSDLSDGILFTGKEEAPSTSSDMKNSRAELLVDYFQLFLNPSSGLVDLQASLVKSTAKLTIQLRNRAGRLLYARNHRPRNGRQVRTQLNLSHLRAGTYTLVLETDTGAMSDQITFED